MTYEKIRSREKREIYDYPCSHNKLTVRWLRHSPSHYDRRRLMLDSVIGVLETTRNTQQH